MFSLNPVQQECVNHLTGPLLILAGPGSGKTRVISERFTHLVTNYHITPERILLLTFTKKAAMEVARRIKSNGVKTPYVTTFHSICSQVLRWSGFTLGLQQNFTVYDKGDQERIVKRVLKSMDLRTADYPVKYIVKHIERAREQKVLNGVDYDFPVQELAGIFQKYESVLEQNNSLDFHSLIVLTVKLFLTCPDIVNEYQEMWQYIMIDEYQDTNDLQFKIIQLLTQFNKNICVVGDDDQSIYGFRGANHKIILRFQEDFEDTLILKLEQNYRSNKRIVNLSNHFIKTNMLRSIKSIWTDNEKGSPIKILSCKHEYDEAKKVTQEIVELVSDGCNPSDIAILYRTNNQAAAFEKEFIRWQLPYTVKSGLSFFERRCIKDIVAYIKCFVNPEDKEAMKRIINTPTRGIGKSTVGKIESIAEENKITFLEAINVCIASKLFSKKITEALKEFISTLTRIDAKSNDVSNLISNIINETGYKEYLNKLGEDDSAESQLEQLRSLYRLSKDELCREQTYIQFLDHISMYQGYDEKPGDSINLMTLHGSKGLEFPVVFITGMEQGLFPSRTAIDDTEIEEERRLCHVDITRAKENLFLSHAKTRRVNGTQEYMSESIFLQEIKGILAVESI